MPNAAHAAAFEPVAYLFDIDLVGAAVGGAITGSRNCGILVLKAPHRARFEARLCPHTAHGDRHDHVTSAAQDLWSFYQRSVLCGGIRRPSQVWQHTLHTVRPTPRACKALASTSVAVRGRSTWALPWTYAPAWRVPCVTTVDTGKRSAGLEQRRATPMRTTSARSAPPSDMSGLSPVRAAGSPRYCPMQAWHG